eukprot:TRINITY_DN1419_c0_g1_i2.p1 TRINITY_DN1419_c0_g1~~TRINITY_DN1419_c0_g1_i2.p1  ORF type:complete len:442 (-),score=77.27 TRINITY_DN1419_c0_g1_i2:494-1819(-)
MPSAEGSGVGRFVGEWDNALLYVTISPSGGVFVRHPHSNNAADDLWVGIAYATHTSSESRIEAGEGHGAPRLRLVLKVDSATGSAYLDGSYVHEGAPTPIYLEYLRLGRAGAPSPAAAGHDTDLASPSTSEQQHSSPTRSSQTDEKKLWEDLSGVWLDQTRAVKITAPRSSFFFGNPTAPIISWLGSTVFPHRQLRVSDVAASVARAEVSCTVTFPGGHATWVFHAAKRSEEDGKVTRVGVYATNGYGHTSQLRLRRKGNYDGIPGHRGKQKPMMLMLVPTSGKHDFDLYTPTCSALHRFTKEQMRSILQAVDRRRLDADVQDSLSQKDCTHHFHTVNIAMFCEAIKQHGYPHATLDQALMEVFAARNDYKHDAEFAAFMRSLLHVKYDLTPTEAQDAAGLQPGDLAPVGLPLHTLSCANTSLESHLKPGFRTVVVGGSWS